MGAWPWLGATAATVGATANPGAAAALAAVGAAPQAQLAQAANPAAMSVTNQMPSAAAAAASPLLIAQAAQRAAAAAQRRRITPPCSNAGKQYQPIVLAYLCEGISLLETLTGPAGNYPTDGRGTS
ncbi:hypothetical protein quinque_004604 [Culex quinquefasciatus]